MDNNLKEIFVYAYLDSIVNNRPKTVYTGLNIIKWISRVFIFVFKPDIFWLASHARRDSAHDYSALHWREPFIITLPSSRYDLNNVERDVKHQIILIN